MNRLVDLLGCLASLAIVAAIAYAPAASGGGYTLMVMVGWSAFCLFGKHIGSSK